MAEKNEKFANEDIEMDEANDLEEHEQEKSLLDILSQEELRTVCEERVCPECELLAREKDKALRAVADADNFKKRMTREKDEFCKFAVSSFVEDIIPVLDNLELALEHGRKNTACKDLVQGVEMTLSLFRQILEKNNLTQVGNIGEQFDPAFHEALAQEEREDMEHGTVCQVMQKGYLLNERLLRPAKVMVSKKCES